MSHRMDLRWNDQIISVEKLHELASDKRLRR